MDQSTEKELNFNLSNNRKRKIAIFANGWNAENLYRFSEGLQKAAPENSVDYFLFLCHATYTYSQTALDSFESIFNLPDLTTFDGAIIFVPGLNFTNMIENIIKRLREANIPTVSICMKNDGFYYLDVDNYSGMKDLCDHLFKVHEVRDVIFIAGSKENADSNTRIRALRDTMKEYNLVLTDEQIFYSNWEIRPVMLFINDLVESGRKMPDAILCANDIIAEVVSYTFEDHGIPIEDSCIITGFDCIDDARLFYPSIASVDQQYTELGEKTVELFAQIFNGGKPDMEQRINCKFFPGESCGCGALTCGDRMRRMITRNLPRTKIDASNAESRLHYIEAAFIGSESYQVLKSELVNQLEQSGAEGDTFYLMLDPLLEEFAVKEISQLPHHTFSDTLEVVSSKYEGKRSYSKYVTREQLIPDYHTMGKNHFYFFMPLFVESFVLGYIVMADNVKYLKEQTTLAWEGAFRRSIPLFRRNVQLAQLNLKLSQLNDKLSELMEKDSLTHVKNRMAFDRFAEKLADGYRNGKKDPFAAVYFDINDLKVINDKLGHEQGDLYIRNCCTLICDTFKHSPVFRIGGDEFVAVVFASDYEKREECMEGLQEEMKDIRRNWQSLDPVDRLSIASGMADYDPDNDQSIFDVFKRADERMYENKYKMKNGQVR